VQPSRDEAVYWLRRAVALGARPSLDALLRLQLGRLGEVDDVFQVFEWLRLGYTSRYPPIQQLLADFAKTLPTSFPRNPSGADRKALAFCLIAYATESWEELAQRCQTLASIGGPVAQYVLGWLYENGRGVAADLQKSVQWYVLAARGGDARAMNALGRMLVQGTGVPANEREGIALVARAAQANYAPAQFNLGYAYEQGLGVPRNTTAAANWYRRAAEHGHARAQFNLGAMLYRGEGVPRDLRAAYRWLTLAAQPQGVDSGEGEELGIRVALAMQRLTPQLSQVEIDKAKAEAEAFRPKGW
jgi:TPR repeat protein